MSDWIDDAKDTAKKVYRSIPDYIPSAQGVANFYNSGVSALKQGYRNLPSSQQVQNMFDTSTSALKTLNNLQPGGNMQKAEPFHIGDISTAVGDAINQAPAYYRGHIKPTLERAWRDFGGR